MVCMFSHWTEAFPCRQATASSVVYLPLEKLTPTGGTPLNFHNNDQGIHFTGKVLQCKKSALFGLFYNTFTAFTTLNPLV